MKPTEVGQNKTGIATSPLGFETFSNLTGATGMPDTEALKEMRLSYSEDAEPVGTMPEPVVVEGAKKRRRKRSDGQAESMSVLLDKLGERLAYERAGVRLYEALLIKLAASHAHDPSITAAELEEIRDDELRHAGLLAAAMQTLGADPTAVTPCADVAGVAGSGFAAVLTDAKTTLTQGLNTMLTVELGDLAGWELLIELCDQLGQDELADQFREAADEEDNHEAKIREWLRISVLGQADDTMDPQTTH